MKLFTVYILKSLIKIVFLTFVAFCGLYVGYMLNHGMEIYFRKQRRQITKKGKLIAYMNRHYDYSAIKKRKYIKQRNEKWLYKKCYSYAKCCDELELKTAIAYLKSDIKLFELFSIIVAIGVGVSPQIANPIAKIISLHLCGFKTYIGLNEKQYILYNENSENLQTFFILIIAILLISLLKKIQKALKKQQYLLCILEDADS